MFQNKSLQSFVLLFSNISWYTKKDQLQNTKKQFSKFRTEMVGLTIKITNLQIMSNTTGSQEFLTFTQHMNAYLELSRVRSCCSILSCVSCFVNHCLSFSSVSFDHSIVWPSIYGFCVFRWHLQILLIKLQLQCSVYKRKHVMYIFSAYRIAVIKLQWQNV